LGEKAVEVTAAVCAVRAITRPSGLVKSQTRTLKPLEED